MNPPSIGKYRRPTARLTNEERKNMTASWNNYLKQRKNANTRKNNTKKNNNTKRSLF